MIQLCFNKSLSSKLIVLFEPMILKFLVSSSEGKTISN